jgi:hypothetical protein
MLIQMLNGVRIANLRGSFNVRIRKIIITKIFPPPNSKKIPTFQIFSTEIVSRTVPVDLLKSIVGCNYIVYDLHECDFEEFEFVLQGLKLAEYKTQTTVVVVSILITRAI